MFSGDGSSRRRRVTLAVIGPLSICASVACGHNAADRASGGSSNVGTAGATSTGNGGTGNGGLGATSGADGLGASGSGSGFIYPAPVAAWQPSQACVDQVAHVLAGMSSRQKAGQMVQADSAGITAADVATYQFGSVFSGGSSDPPTDDAPQTWRTFGSRSSTASTPCTATTT
jgi:hypothetical protein